jgi:peptide/nickel transport system substrate-binding protein
MSKRLLIAHACLSAISAMAFTSAHAQSVLRSVPPSDLKILDPIWTTASITRNHGYMIYDTLFGMSEKGEFKPQMIEKYSVSADNKVWAFTLRPGLKFHDETPVTSEDVIASLARWSKRDALGQKMFAAMESITAEGANGFRMTFKQPFGMVLDALAKSSPPVPFIMPKRVAETPADKQIDNLIGSGPFTLAKEDFRPGDKVVYRKNVNYVPRKDVASGTAGGKVVNIDKVVWVFLRDPQTQTNAILNGEVDVLEIPPAARYPELRTSNKVDLIDLVPAGPFTAILNHKVPPFNNGKIRQAAYLAVNQEALLRAQTLYRDFYKPCTSIYLCSSAYGNEKHSFFTGKPQFEEARKLLKEAGYDGKPVVILLPADFPLLNKMPVVYGELLKQAGFNVDVQTTDWASLLARRAKKDLPENGGWNIFITLFGGADASNPALFPALTGNGDQGYFGWPVDSELEALKTQFIGTSDVAKRKAIADRIQARAFETGLFVPLGEARGPSVVRKNAITGVLPAPMFTYWNIQKVNAPVAR